MDQKIDYDGQEYAYKISVSFGDVHIHLHENDDLISRSGINSHFQSTDLQGSRAFYKNALGEKQFGIFTQNVILKSSDNSRVCPIDSDLYLIQGPKNKSGFVRQIKHLLYAISEKKRQEKKNECTIHGAAVEVPGKGAVLILGDKGSGKTITSYTLCHDHNANLIGNDLVIVGQESSGELYVHGGTTNITMRKSIVQNLFPELCSEIPILKKPFESTEYEEKFSFQANLANIKTCVEKTPLSLISRVNVHPYANDNKSTNVFAKEIEALRLHENLSRYIRGQTTPVCLEDDGTISGYYQSLDSEHLQDTRNKMISKLLESKFIYLTAKSPYESSKLIKNALGI